MASRMTLDRLSESEVRTATSSEASTAGISWRSPRKITRGAKAEARRFPLQFLTQRTIADEKKLDIRHALMDLCGDAQESGMILVAMVHARDHADTRDTGTFRQSRGCGAESRGRQGVSDDSDFIGREASGDEAIGRRLRIADNSVAPAKSGGLSAELRGGHQVSELAMAADDDRHAGKLGGGNQREIGVEIEGVRDLHLMMAQMAAQAEASAQRLPSVEAATQRELGSVREIVGERAAAADAAEMNLELWRSEILREDGELALGSSRFKSIDHEKQADRRIRKIRKTGKFGWTCCGQAGRFGGVHPIILPPERRLARRRNGRLAARVGDHGQREQSSGLDVFFEEVAMPELEHQQTPDAPGHGLAAVEVVVH